MTTTTQTIRLINHTGEPIPNTYEGRECQVRTDRQLNQRSSLHGSSLTLDHDSAVTAVLPPVEEGVYRVLPRELVLACRSLQRRPDVLTVDRGGMLIRLTVIDDRESILEYLLLFQQARFLLMQDPDLTVQQAYHQARGVNTVDIWGWHYMLDIVPLDRMAYRSGDPAPIENLSGTEAVTAMTAVIDNLSEALGKL